MKLNALDCCANILSLPGLLKDNRNFSESIIKFIDRTFKAALSFFGGETNSKMSVDILLSSFHLIANMT